MDDAYSDELLAQLRRRSTFGAFISRHDFQLRSSSSGGDSLDRSETLPSKQLRDEVGNSAPHFFSEFPEYAPSVQAILETEMPAVQKISKIAAEILRTDGSPVPTMDIPGKASIEEEDTFNDPKRAAETPEIAEEDVEAEYMDEPEEPDAEGLDTFIADDSPEDLEGVPKELKTDETGSKVEDLESTKLEEKDPCDCPGLVPKEPETSDPETPVVQEEFEEKTEAEATEDWANSGIEIPDKAIIIRKHALKSAFKRFYKIFHGFAFQNTIKSVIESLFHLGSDHTPTAIENTIKNAFTSVFEIFCKRKCAPRHTFKNTLKCLHGYVLKITFYHVFDITNGFRRSTF
ncbi:hypothetical protein SLS60_003352 [Paraconiothyrium brasiliense]|uniref:Uncharacterized protein n=1 Tax=Paraconiothyrium brasiliense TaxID=300254 RepID=A0ABR3RVF7_9PLEO